MWRHLQPWRDALRGSLTRDDQHDAFLPPGPDSLFAPTCVRFMAWPRNSSDRGCHLQLVFPADEVSRSCRSKLQRVREAIELFTALAAVDLAAFAKYFREFLSAQDLEWVTSGRVDVLHLSWMCVLKGRLSPEDPGLKKTAATWADLLGCPDDPWNYSAEFQAAMASMETLGKAKYADRCDSVAFVRWYPRHEAVPVNAYQVVKKKKETWEEFCHHLGQLFSANVPAAAYVYAVRDGTALLKSWNSPRRMLEEESFRSEVKLEESGRFQPGIRDLTAALAHTYANTFSLSLQEGEDIPLHLLARAIADTGYLFSALIAGHSLSICRVADENDETLDVLKGTTYDHLDIDVFEDSGTRLIDQAFSAVAEMPSGRKLTVTGDLAVESIALWRWLAFAVFSRKLTNSFSKVEVRSLSIRAVDVLAVAAVLNCNYPRPDLQLNVSELQRTGWVDIKAGVELHPTLLEQEDGSGFFLSRDCRCRALCAVESGVANVVVPGYGICKLNNCSDQFVADNSMQRNVPGHLEHGIDSLWLEGLETESGTVLTDLLALVGRKLQTLFISGTDEIDGRDPAEVDLSAIAAACPELTSLRIEELNVSLSAPEALHNWGLGSLIIVNCEQSPDLAPCLSDASSHMAQALVELKISPCFTDEGRMSELNPHDGDILPITKEKFPLKSKAAVISAVWNSSNERRHDIRAIHRLDAMALSLIFGFAATPERRTVQVLADTDQSYLKWYWTTRKLQQSTTEETPLIPQVHLSITVTEVDRRLLLQHALAARLQISVDFVEELVWMNTDLLGLGEEPYGYEVTAPLHVRLMSISDFSLA